MIKVSVKSSSSSFGSVLVLKIPPTMTSIEHDNAVDLVLFVVACGDV